MNLTGDYNYIYKGDGEQIYPGNKESLSSLSSQISLFILHFKKHKNIVKYW